MPNRALLFPGQGAHDPWMVQNALARKDERLELIESLLGKGLLDEAVNDTSLRSRNEVASLMTAWWSLKMLEEQDLEDVKALGGYSVGQFVACCAGGLWSPEDTIRLIHGRALLMNNVTENLEPMGMIAVIGLMSGRLESWLNEQKPSLESLEITNFNAPGQLTLGGTLGQLESFESRISELKPRKVMRLDVSGAWHHSALSPVVTPLKALMESFPCGEATSEILSNLDGAYLPTEGGELYDAMASQVARPVMWEAGLRQLIARGCDEFIETGYGSVLSRFGFFIDRSVKHRAVQTEVKAP